MTMMVVRSDTSSGAGRRVECLLYKYKCALLETLFFRSGCLRSKDGGRNSVLGRGKWVFVRAPGILVVIAAVSVLDDSLRGLDGAHLPVLSLEKFCYVYI